MRTLIWSALILSWATGLFAQSSDVKFERVSLQHGLSQSTVFCVLQDSQGFMWFGTQDGLNKFDGINFTVYRHNIYDSTSISESWINTIYEDLSGTVWIGTNGGGLNKFDRRSKSFKSYQYNPKSVHNTIRAILEDHLKVLWIATDHGLYHFDRSLEQFDRFRIDASLPAIEVIRDIYQDSRGKIWVSLAKSLVTIERAATDNQSFEVDSSLQLAEYISTIYEDDSGVVWLGTTAQGLIQIDAANRVTRLGTGEGATLSNPLITAISEDHSGNLWVGTPDGINVYDRKGTRFHTHRHNPIDPKSLSNNSVQDIYRDISGSMWVGTAGGGISKVDPNRKKFTTFEFDPTTQPFPNQKFIWAFEEDRRGSIWIGTNSGIKIFQKGEYELELCEQVNQTLGQYPIRSITEDRSGTIWFGSRRGGLFRISPNAPGYGKLDQITNRPSDSESLSSNWINTIYEDASGVLWIGTFNGLNQLLVSSTGPRSVNGVDSGPKFKRFLHTPNQRSLSSPTVTAIVEDANNDLWIGTTVGLNKFNPERGDFRRYLHQADAPEKGISDNYILSLHADSSGMLWVGTSEGLNKLNIDTGENTIYAATDGFPNDVVYGILPDDAGYLWLSTNRGLCRFDPKEETFRNYDATDGLQSDEFNAGACLRTDSGGMYFGGINGFNSFFPEEIQDNPVVPPIVITKFSIFDKPVPIEDEISLSYDENFFSFEFAALNFTNPQKNSYAYQLAGFDEQWIMSGTRRYASYTNLDPGEYLLRVKGANNDGAWNKEGVSLRIQVVPPFWETNWFYALLFASLAACMFFAHDYRLKARLRKHEEYDRIRKIESETVRSRTAHDFHDEMGHKLTRISVLCEMVKRKSDGSWQRIKDLIDEISENSSSLYRGTKDFIWAIDPQSDSLYEVVIRLKDFGDELFANTDIDFEMTGATDDLQAIILPLDFKRHIALIFKEGMTNVLKHSRCNQVMLRFFASDKQLKITLSDDGEGFINHESFSGHGLRNMKTRAQQIDSQLVINSEIGQGTRINFRSDILVQLEASNGR